MNEIFAYERDPYLQDLEAQVLETGECQGRPWARLDDTLCYPEGGGQPSDRGWLGERRILEVHKSEHGLRHVLDGPIQPGRTKMTLDWPRRWDHMQQHTAQHLLTALAQDRFGWVTTAFHLGEMVSDIELDAPGIRPRDLESLEEAAAQAIGAAHPIRAWRVQPEEYARLPVRSRGLPEGHQGDIRLVEIQGLDLNTCGGTHLKGTSELEAMKLLGTEPIRGGTRLFYVSGRRLRNRLKEHEARNAQFRTYLGAPDEDLVSSLLGRLDMLKQAERRQKTLEDDLASLWVELLCGRSETLLEAHFEDRDSGFLNRLAKNLTERRPEALVFLTSSLKESALFLLSAGSAQNTNLRELGQEVAQLLKGKGGGSERFFQGKASDLNQRPAVIQRLQQA